MITRMLKREKYDDNINALFHDTSRGVEVEGISKEPSVNALKYIIYIKRLIRSYILVIKIFQNFLLLSNSTSLNVRMD